MKISRKLLDKKWLIIFVVVAIIAGLIFISSSKNQSKPLEFFTVKKQNIAATTSTSGTLGGKTTLNLKFKTSGKLAYVNVKAGDTVTQGQAIAGLDTQDLQIALQQAQNNYTSAQATALNVEDQVKGHNGDETFTQKQTRTTAQTARDSAYDSIKAAQRAFQDTVIYSPINGIITTKNFEPNQFISPADTVAQVVDESDFYFLAEVDEADISKVTLGQNAKVNLDAYPNQTFRGAVAEISPDIQSTSSGTKVVIAKINLGQPAIHFIVGLSGQAVFTTEEAKNVLTIPIEALRSDNKVVINNPQGLTEVSVVPGIQSDADVEIKQGLQEGQNVLKNPPAELPKKSTNPLSRLFGTGRS